MERCNLGSVDGIPDAPSSGYALVTTVMQEGFVIGIGQFQRKKDGNCAEVQWVMPGMSADTRTYTRTHVRCECDLQEQRHLCLANTCT